MLYRINERISTICQQLECDSFLSQERRKELENQLTKLVQQRQAVETALSREKEEIQDH